MNNSQPAGKAEPFQAEPELRHGIQRIIRNFDRDDSASATRPALATLGPYRIEARLGSGGMGTVFRAVHTRLKRIVALKVLPASRWSNASAIARFEREMEAIGQLDHPHIVRASDAGDDQGMHYLVMEYMDGLDLGRISDRLGPLPVLEVCALAQQAALGLQHAHDAGLVHRDVKPSNLMLAWDRGSEDGRATDPTVKLLDLGLALLGDEQLHERHDVTTVGALMGTLDYMSPEQGIDSHAVDHRADIYGLGATVFKLLTGRAPYADAANDTLMKKMTALATKPAPSVGSIRPDLPSPLVELVDRMLERDPDRRFARASDIANELDEMAAPAELSTLLQRAEESPDPMRSQHVDVASFVELQSVPTEMEPRAESNGSDSGRIRKNWWWAAIVGMLFLGAFGGLAWRIATDYGTIVVESDDPDAKLVVKQQDEVVERIELEQGKGQLRIRTGIYSLEFEGDAASLVVEPTVGEVTRRGQLSFSVSKKESQTVADRVAEAQEDAMRMYEELESYFPEDAKAINWTHTGRAVALSGQVAEGNLQRILRIAKQYFPDVINDLEAVSGLPVLIELTPLDTISTTQMNYVEAKIKNQGDKPLTFARMQFSPDHNLVPQLDKSPGASFGPSDGRLDWNLDKIPPGFSKTVIAAFTAHGRIPGTETLSHFYFSCSEGMAEQRVLAKIETDPAVTRDRSLNSPSASSEAMYDGRTLSEWLNGVQFERKPDRLAEAILAIDAMVYDDANQAAVEPAMDAIFKMTRELGHDNHSNRQPRINELAWTVLTKLPHDKLLARAIKEVTDGNARSREFLTYFLYPTISQKNLGATPEWDLAEDFLIKLRGSTEFVSAVVNCDDRAWATDFLYDLCAGGAYAGRSLEWMRFEEDAEFFRNSLKRLQPSYGDGAAEDPHLLERAKAAARLAMIAPDSDGLALEIKRLLLNPAKVGAARTFLPHVYCLLALEHLEADAHPCVNELLRLMERPEAHDQGILLIVIQQRIPEYANLDGAGVMKTIIRILGAIGPQAKAALPHLYKIQTGDAHELIGDEFVDVQNLSPPNSPDVRALAKEAILKIEPGHEFETEQEQSDPFGEGLAEETEDPFGEDEDPFIEGNDPFGDGKDPFGDF